MKPVYWILTIVVLGMAGCTLDPKAQSRNWVEKGNKYVERNKTTEASIMYRRALQKDAKNASAWYRLGLLNLKLGKAGEARAAFIRVTDLVDAGGRVDLAKADISDAFTKLADIDYLGFVTSYGKGQDNAQKEFRQQLRNISQRLNLQAPKSFEAYRVAGLYDWATALTPRPKDPVDPRERSAALQSALDNFLLADHLHPYETTLGFAIVSTYFDTQQSAPAEKYAQEMIARNTADHRVYDLLWRYYFNTGKVDQAEEIRKKDTAQNPKNAEAWLRLAGHYAAARRKNEMVAVLNRLTSDRQTFPDAPMLVGDFYYANYDFKAALEQYQQGEKSDPRNKATYLKKSAEALTFQGRQDEASKLIAQVLKEYPKDAEAIAMNASLQLNHAKPADADKIIAQLQPLLAQTPGNMVDQATIIHFNLGRAHALKGDPQSLDQARLQFQEVMNLRTSAQRPPYIPALLALSELELQKGDSAAAIGHAEQILRIAPVNVMAHLIRAMGLSNMEEYDKARTELDAILKYDPKSNDARFQLGRMDLLQKRFPQAEAEFDSLAKANDPRGFRGVLDSKVKQGKLAEAIQLIQAQLIRVPNNAGLRELLANLYFATGKFSESGSEYGKLLEANVTADPRSRELWTIRSGECMRRSGDPEGALVSFNKARDLAPNDAAPLLEIAMLQDAAGKSLDARKTYESVLKIQPDNPVALNNIAYYNADNNTDLDQALSYAQRAQAKSPRDLSIEDTLGLIYYKKDLLDESSRLFTELVAKAPANPTFHLHLAMTLYKKGNKPQAKHELEAARRNRPSNREQEQIKALLFKMGI